MTVDQTRDDEPSARVEDRLGGELSGQVDFSSDPHDAVGEPDEGRVVDGADIRLEASGGAGRELGDVAENRHAFEGRGDPIG